MIHGAIFECSSATRNECFNRCLFGLPRSQWKPFVSKITPQTVCFLYCFTDKTLHGIFQPSGPPGLEIERNAWTKVGSGASTPYPAQVRVQRKPLVGPASLLALSAALHQELTTKDGRRGSSRVMHQLDEHRTAALVQLFEAGGSPPNAASAATAADDRLKGATADSENRSVIPKGAYQLWRDAQPAGAESNKKKRKRWMAASDAQKLEWTASCKTVLKVVDLDSSGQQAPQQAQESNDFNDCQWFGESALVSFLLNVVRLNGGAVLLERIGSNLPSLREWNTMRDQVKDFGGLAKFMAERHGERFDVENYGRKARGKKVRVRLRPYVSKIMAERQNYGRKARGKKVASVLPPLHKQDRRKCPKCPFDGNRQSKGKGKLRAQCSRCCKAVQVIEKQHEQQHPQQRSAVVDRRADGSRQHRAREAAVALAASRRPPQSAFPSGMRQPNALGGSSAAASVFAALPGVGRGIVKTLPAWMTKVGGVAAHVGRRAEEVVPAAAAEHRAAASPSFSSSLHDAAAQREADIEDFAALGFQRAEAIEALANAGGNADRALAALSSPTTRGANEEITDEEYEKVEDGEDDKVGEGEDDEDEDAMGSKRGARVPPLSSATERINHQRTLALESAKQRGEKRRVERQMRTAALQSAQLRHKEHKPPTPQLLSVGVMELEPFLEQLGHRILAARRLHLHEGAAPPVKGSKRGRRVVAQQQVQSTEKLAKTRAEREKKEAEDAAASAAEAQEEISSASAPPPAAPPQASAAAAPLHTAVALRTFSQIEIDGMRVVDLKEELVNRSLSTKGLKAVLKARLVVSCAAQEVISEYVLRQVPTEQWAEMSPQQRKAWQNRHDSESASGVIIMEGSKKTTLLPELELAKVEARRCDECNVEKLRDCFSKTQWERIKYDKKHGKCACCIIKAQQTKNKEEGEAHKKKAKKFNIPFADWVAMTRSQRKRYTQRQNRRDAAAVAAPPAKIEEEKAKQQVKKGKNEKHEEMMMELAKGARENASAGVLASSGAKSATTAPAMVEEEHAEEEEIGVSEDDDMDVDVPSKTGSARRRKKLQNLLLGREASRAEAEAAAEVAAEVAADLAAKADTEAGEVVPGGGEAPDLTSTSAPDSSEATTKKKKKKISAADWAAMTRGQRWNYLYRAKNQNRRDAAAVAAPPAVEDDDAEGGEEKPKVGGGYGGYGNGGGGGGGYGGGYGNGGGYGGYGNGGGGGHYQGGGYPAYGGGGGYDARRGGGGRGYDRRGDRGGRREERRGDRGYDRRDERRDDHDDRSRARRRRDDRRRVERRVERRSRSRSPPRERDRD